MYTDSDYTAPAIAQVNAGETQPACRPAPCSSVTPPPPVTGASSLPDAPVTWLPAAALAPIVEAVCAAFRVTHDEIVSRRRGQHIVLARHVAIYLIRELTDYSFPRIGEYFARDHSTAIHGYTRISRRVAAEAPFRALLQKLKDALATRLARTLSGDESENLPPPSSGAPSNVHASFPTTELSR